METTKVTPSNRELEDMVLGCVLLESKSLNRIEDYFTDDLFYQDDNKSVCNAILSLKNSSRQIDIVTVCGELKKMRRLEDVGGAFKISQLANRVASSLHIDNWVQALRELAARRAMISHFGDLYHKAFDSFHEVDDLILQNEIFTSKISGESTSSIMDSKTLAIETRKIIDAQSNKQGITGIPSGFKDIDGMTGGWQNGDLIILGARPGMGKTSLILQFIKNPAIYHKIPVAMFSIEMSRNPIYMRLMAQESGISLNKITGKSTTKINQFEKDSLDKSCSPLYEAPIYFDDTAAITLRSFCSKCRTLVSKFDVKLIAADYLQLMRGNKKVWSREQEVSEITRTIKALAKELNIPIILISSVSRELEKRPNKKPILSDLRESGNIESDADLVLLLYRPEYYGIPEIDGQEGVPIDSKGKAIIEIAKHRNGSTGDILMNWDAYKTMFSNYGEISFSEPLSPNESFETQPF